jgi:heme oxygenase
METRVMHPEADAPWVELMSIEATRERYIETLLATYGFEAPIEAAVALTPGVSGILPLRPRARSGFIVQDLLGLGFSPSRIARLPQCCNVVPFRDAAEALGWMYVVERATLLHETVRHHLQARLPNVRAWSYLSAYEGIAGKRWQELGHALDMAAQGDHDDQIIAAAKSAFTTLHQWFASGEAHAVIIDNRLREADSRSSNRA